LHSVHDQPSREDIKMRTLAFPIALTAVLTLSGCAGMSDTERRTVEGGAIGAAGGALIGSFSANAGKGALIGAGVGALGGYLFDQNEKSKEAAYEQGYRDAQSR
jgi:uncharacterized protein YcfJ